MEEVKEEVEDVGNGDQVETEEGRHMLYHSERSALMSEVASEIQQYSSHLLTCE